MNDILKIIGREKQLFVSDFAKHEAQMSEIIANSSFLVIGAAGSIGSAVVREIFARNLENNAVRTNQEILASIYRVHYYAAPINGGFRVGYDFR